MEQLLGEATFASPFFGGGVPRPIAIAAHAIHQSNRQTDTGRQQRPRFTPGLVAVYDIRPGNGAGLFSQPRSPHRAGSFLFMRTPFVAELPNFTW